MLIKLLLLAAAAYGVWHFWRRISPSPRNDDAGKGARASATKGIEDMAQCPACLTYVAASARACGRQDCPRRG